METDRLSPTEVGNSITHLGNGLKEWEVYFKRDLGGIARKAKELDFSLQDCNPAVVEKTSRARLDKLKIPRSAGARPKDVVVAKGNIPVISKIIGGMYWRVGAKLGLSQDKLEHIRSSSRGNDTKAAAAVITLWAEKEKDSATVKQLAKVVDRYDTKLANCIRDLQTADANTLARAFSPRHIYDLFGEEDIFAVSLRLRTFTKRWPRSLA
ncbi:uncharacterized protein [Ptychodera flava]|uniref:uncharacterized protein n=1 Tax=Ptychodera flava TaxID=63121 RepID=UPI00396A8875